MRYLFTIGRHGLMVLAAICLLAACSALDTEQEWPIQTAVGQPGGRHALLIAAKPNAPCTDEILADLATVMSDTDRRPRVFVLFSRPAGGDFDDRSDPWWNAVGIEGVEVIDDPGGVEARKFEASPNSALRYSPRGKLVATTPLTCGESVAAIEDLRSAFVVRETKSSVAALFERLLTTI